MCKLIIISRCSSIVSNLFSLSISVTSLEMANLYATKVNHLCDAIVKNELLCREIKIDGSTVSSRKQKLIAALEYEHSLPSQRVLTPYLPIGEDISTCQDILKFLKTEFDNKGVIMLDSLTDRLEFLNIRLKRIVISSTTEPILADQWAALRRDTDEFDRLLSHQTSFDVENTNFENRLAQLNLNDTPSCNSTTNNGGNVNHQHLQNNNKLKVPVYKWRIKFSGDKILNGKVVPSAPDFLRDVNALSRSRNISLDELFLAASDLFEGTAARWFRASVANGLVNNWQQLQAKLIHDFEGVDYWDDLYDSIRARIQQPNESVIEYFSFMEDNFSKLENMLVSDQIRILRKNILPIYARQLVIYNYNTVQSLMDDCKAIESIENKNKNRFRRDQSPLPNNNSNRNFNPNRINSMYGENSNRQVRFSSPYHSHNDFSNEPRNFSGYRSSNLNRNNQQASRSESSNRMDRNRASSPINQNYFCSICKRTGHTRNFCNNRSENSIGADDAGPSSVPVERGPSTSPHRA